MLTIQARMIPSSTSCATYIALATFGWGHPYRRWTSFFAVGPDDELVRSRALVFGTFGTAKTSTSVLSQEVAVAKLLAASQDVTVGRVPDADHSLVAPGDDLSALEREYRRGLDWYWAGGPRSVPKASENPV